MTIGARDNPTLGFKDPKQKYERTWPNYCRRCNGSGVVEYEDDPSAGGVALSPGTMTFEDPCDCFTMALCPRCGRYIHKWMDEVFDDPFPECPVCGWKFKHSETCP